MDEKTKREIQEETSIQATTWFWTIIKYIALIWFIAAMLPVVGTALFWGIVAYLISMNPHP